MMKSHLAIFFAATEKAGVVIPAECAPIVDTAWLTVSPLIDLTG